ncbi:unnamed protein product, partial [Hapterophycus canaliculatus]
GVDCRLFCCTRAVALRVQVQTLGVDFKLKTIVINDEEVDLQVWDTAGQVTSSFFLSRRGV